MGSIPGAIRSAVVAASIVAAVTGCSGSDEVRGRPDQASTTPESNGAQSTNAKSSNRLPRPPRQVLETLAKQHLSSNDRLYLEGTAYLRCQQADLPEMSRIYGTPPKADAVAGAVAKSWTNSAEVQQLIRRGCLDALLRRGG